MKIIDILKKYPIPRLEYYILAEHLLKCSRTWLLAHENDEFSNQKIKSFESVFYRRFSGEPIAYILGKIEFMGHSFFVTKSVFIPRLDTELLVEEAIQYIKKKNNADVLDIGTGSGVIAISLSLLFPLAQFTVTDISEEALIIAKYNIIHFKLEKKIKILKGNYFSAISKNIKFDLIVSNPPYIRGNDPHLNKGDLRFEPRISLTDEKDGLSACKKIIFMSKKFLRPDGAIWIEHGWNQAKSIKYFLKHAGLYTISSILDFSGIERISGGYYY